MNPHDAQVPAPRLLPRDNRRRGGSACRRRGYHGNLHAHAGGLSISAPAGSVSIGTQAVSASPTTISGQLGVVTVTDQRGGATTWVTSVIVTAFTPTTGPAVTAIAADKVSYAAGVITQVGVTATKPATTDLTGVSPVVNGASTGLSSAAWNPTISVTLPADAAPGVYTATITHSVA